MQIPTDQLWVVVYRLQNSRSLDTDMPEEVFTTREAAEVFCAQLNHAPKTLSWELDQPYLVLTLAARLAELRSLLLRSVYND